MKNLTPEMIEKAKAAKSAEELLEIAKENNVEMTADEAATYFAQLNPKSGEINDDDLDNVAGGACAENNYGKTVIVTSGQTCKKCGSNRGVLLFGGQESDEIICEKHDEVRIAYVYACTYEIID